MFLIWELNDRDVYKTVYHAESIVTGTAAGKRTMAEAEVGLFGRSWQKSFLFGSQTTQFDDSACAAGKRESLKSHCSSLANNQSHCIFLRLKFVISYN